LQCEFNLAITHNSKNSFLEYSAERDLAIVSSISGTTRDCIETRIQLNGQLVNVVDTAGIRTDTADPLEREGIRRTRERAASANLVLLVMDASQNRQQSGEVEKLLAEFRPNKKDEIEEEQQQKVIICVNKADLIGPDEQQRRREMETG
jgi:tRNA modification GTPase